LLAGGLALLSATSLPPEPSLTRIFAKHRAAVAALHLREPRSYETVGTLTGLDSRPAWQRCWT
jgi:hypothetical protein